MEKELQLSAFIVTEKISNTPIGILKEVFVEGVKEKIEMIIHEGVKRGIPFQRTETGVKFNFWK